MEEIEVLEIEEKPKKRKLKKSVKLFLLLVFLLIIVSIIFGIYSFSLSKVSDSKEEITFTVAEGSSVYNVGKKLKQEGLIRSEYSYKLYVKLNNINEYKAGTYILKKNYGTKKIVEILQGNSYLKDGFYITFKEGKTIRSIVSEVIKNTNITEEEFYKTLENENYIDQLIEKYWFLTDDIKNKDIYYSLEGYLFPDTYMFDNNVTVDDIIVTMLNQTDKIFSKYKDDFNTSNFSINEIVTLASIIESEGIYKDDRKNISGVFYNRLNSNMSLGSDVTTYYAFKVDLGARDLTKEEINTYNPYNTRGPKMEGKLPVGAISNFSETSLDAALNPTNNDYYYFVADKSGKTHFTKTYAQHQQIISELKNAGNWLEW